MYTAERRQSKQDMYVAAGLGACREVSKLQSSAGGCGGSLGLCCLLSVPRAAGLEPCVL